MVLVEFQGGAEVNAFVYWDIFEHSWWLLVQLLLTEALRDELGILSGAS